MMYLLLGYERKKKRPKKGVGSEMLSPRELSINSITHLGYNVNRYFCQNGLNFFEK